MRHLQSTTHFRLALYEVQDAEGYVDALLGIAREKPSPSLPCPARPHLWLNPPRPKSPRRERETLH